jgi:hypothetical protein
MRVLRWLIFWGFIGGAVVWSVLLSIVIDQHLPVPNAGIALGGGSLSCTRVMERLALAQSAITLPGWAGLSTRTAATGPRARAALPSRPMCARLQARVTAALAARPALPERPAWLAGLGLAPPDLDTVSPFANLRLWIAAFPGSYAGQGLWHYLRCDYPLTAGPRHGLTMAALHVHPNPPAPGCRRSARAHAECGLRFRPICCCRCVMPTVIDHDRSPPPAPRLPAWATNPVPSRW